MHMNLNYARHHWTKPGGNPPLGLILCAEKGAEEARYALENLPNKILAAIWAHFCTLRKKCQTSAVQRKKSRKGRGAKHRSRPLLSSGRGGKSRRPLSGLGRGRSQIRQKNVDTLRTQ